MFLGGGGATTTINGSTITINGDLYLKNSTWHRSVDGVYRLYYATNEISYYCCGGNSTDGHIFMNNAYSHVFKIKNNGDLFSSGNVGIGITNPNCRLYISSNLAASATVFAMRLSCGASTDGGDFGTLFGLGSEPHGWSKCAIGHT